MSEIPDWVQVGAKVAEYTYGRPGTVRLTTIERLTATQVVLANGNRYRRDTLRPVGGSKRSAWSEHSELRSAVDPRVVNVHARQRLDAVRRKVEEIVRAAGNDVGAVQVALDDIERIVKTARAAIQRRR